LARFVSNYVQCNARQRRILDRDIITAQKWLDLIIRRLNVPDDDAKRKVKNVFHIEAGSSYAVRLVLLQRSYQRLRQSMDESFPLQCETRSSLFSAWVDNNDPTGTMHFPPGHFTSAFVDQVARIIHERSHTVFQIGHDGMSGAGAVDFGRAPDDDNGFIYEQANRNAYCYGWLAQALQPDYARPEEGETIIVSPRRPR